MRIDEITNDLGRHYVRVWTRALHEFLGWPEDRALAWCEKWVESLNNPNEMIYNQTPIYYVAFQLIPEALKIRFPSYELQFLKTRLIGVIQDGDCFFDQKPDFDWAAARRRVEEVLGEYGEKLPVFDQTQK